MTHCARILNALRDEQWHTTAHLYRTVGPCILHSRISDLRRKGHNVEGRHVPHKTGADGYEYRLKTSVPGDAPASPGRTPFSGPSGVAAALGGSREHVRGPVDQPPPRAAVPGLEQTHDFHVFHPSGHTDNDFAVVREILEAVEQLVLPVAPEHYDI